jgi:hypothetical protein
MLIARLELSLPYPLRIFPRNSLRHTNLGAPTYLGSKQVSWFMGLVQMQISIHRAAACPAIDIA